MEKEKETNNEEKKNANETEKNKDLTSEQKKETSEEKKETKKSVDRWLTLLSACLVAILALGLSIAGTSALFMDSFNATGHLESGSLKLSLKRTKLEKAVLDSETGYLKTIADEEEKSFTEPNRDNVFGIEENEKIVPGSYFKVTLELSNVGSSAFTYDVILKTSSEVNTLAEQIKITFNDEEKGYLSDFVSEGSALVASKTITKSDASDIFTLKMEFTDLPNGENNQAMSSFASFDLLVKAVQKVSA